MKRKRNNRIKPYNKPNVDRNIKSFFEKKMATLLCIGPMSKACVDATVDIAAEIQVPMTLIASRRQIDSTKMKGGYVENWDTKQFISYVRSLQNGEKIILARDHGGPYQHPSEIDQNLGPADAMDSAKASFEEDILSGMNLIHLDPSVPGPGENLNLDTILERLFELFGHCYEFAKKENKKVFFEFGTEEQTGYGQDVTLLEYFLKQTDEFCKKNNFIKPLFVVVQTGTKVLETENVGETSNLRFCLNDNYIDVIRKSSQLCRKYGCYLKEHNGDYLLDEVLSLRPQLGIHATNIAPEYGVIETRTLMGLLSLYGLKVELDKFIQISLESKKWKKWLKTNSVAIDFERAVISGHYIYSNSEVINIKNILNNKMAKKGYKLENVLMNAVKSGILKHMRSLKLII